MTQEWIHEQPAEWDEGKSRGFTAHENGELRRRVPTEPHVTSVS